MNATESRLSEIVHSASPLLGNTDATRNTVKKCNIMYLTFIVPTLEVLWTAILPTDYGALKEPDIIMINIFICFL
jgi:hypothetical protein